jgi:hypothetical protein
MAAEVVPNRSAIRGTTIAVRLDFMAFLLLILGRQL